MMFQAQHHRGMAAYDDSRYRCCCVHVRIGTIVIGIIELVGVILNFLGVIINYSVGTVGRSAFSLGTGITGTILFIIVIIMLFYAIVKERPAFVIPHLIYQVIGIIGLFIGALMTIIALASGKRVYYGDYGFNEETANESFLLYSIIVIIILIVCAVIEIWCFFVVYKFYCYLKEKSSYHSPVIRYS